MSSSNSQKTNTSDCTNGTAVPHDFPLICSETKSIIWGMQQRAIQSMLDFDYVCRRKEPSVSAIIYPFSGSDHKMKYYWGHKEILIPVYTQMKVSLQIAGLVTGNYHYRKLPLPHDIFITATITGTLNLILTVTINLPI